MTAYPSDPLLADWARWIDRTGWSAFILDGDFYVRWISQEAEEFIGESDPDKLGIGQHLGAAFFSPAWIDRTIPESMFRLFSEIVPLAVGDPDLRRALADNVPEGFREYVETAEAKPMPFLFASHFDYKRDDLPAYQVNLLAMRLHDESGKRVGCIFLFFMDVRPNLLALLARGDQAMYERMANLVEPKRRQGAVLFADLEASGALSRQLPTVQYFKLVRALSTCLDDVVAAHHGIIGKHAGDGASAFFLIDDLGSASQAARAAISAARDMQDRVDSLEVSLSADLGPCALNVGLHWGAGLFMGQLVPGGRLDVTALGDEVNECARIQESSRGRAILASKALIEQLTDDDASALGIDLEKLVYSPLAEIDGATEKARRDAGVLPVTRL